MVDEIRVLHVEDDEEFAAVAARLIEEDDRFTVETESDPREALDRLDGVDCVVSDYRMDEMTGLDLLEAFRERDSGLPFILFTGKGSETVASEAISAGVTDYIRKRRDPEQFAVLRRRIENAVARHRAERERATERRRRTALFENADAPMIEVEFVGEDPFIANVNPAFEDVFGFDADEIEGRSVTETLVPEEEYEAHLELRERARNGERIETMVHRETTDGSRDFQLRIIPFTDTDPSGAYAWYVDVTDHLERERLLEDLHDGTRELMTAESKEEVVEVAARTLQQHFRYATTGVRLLRDGRLEMVAVETDHEELDETSPAYEVGEGLVGRAFADGEARLFDDLDAVDASFDYRPARSAMLIPIGDHGIIGIASLESAAFDEADLDLGRLFAANVESALERAEREERRRERERELTRQNDRLEELTDILAHDLRNPLAVARGAFERFKETEEGAYLERVEECHERIDALLEDVLTLARWGRAVEEGETKHLGNVARNCWRALDTDDATITIEVDRVVETDPVRLEHLFENLFQNAIEHGDADEIHVGEIPDGFYVADDGTGIPPEDREKVFDPEYSTAKDGTGLGLSIVKRSAEAHGWEISLTESADGGCRFEFREMA